MLQSFRGDRVVGLTMREQLQGSIISQQVLNLLRAKQEALPRLLLALILEIMYSLV